MTAIVSPPQDRIRKTASVKESNETMDNTMVVPQHHREEKSVVCSDVSDYTSITEDSSDSSSSFSSDATDLLTPATVPLQLKSQLETDNNACINLGRAIRFAAEVQYHSILHRLDYSPEEKSACWYVQREFVAVREEAQALIDLIESGAEIPDHDDLPSPRGLENYFTSGARVAILNHSYAVNAVLTEQCQQQLAGINDDKAIAKMYRKVSLRCRFPARMQALVDQEEALDKSSAC